jgi:hypothetical protein
MKPSTPLPWREFQGEESWDIIGANGDHIACMEPHEEERTAEQSADAPYIAHAANAYPKLVEALRENIGVFAQLTAAYPAQNGMVNKRLDALHALLRALGE